LVDFEGWWNKWMEIEEWEEEEGKRSHFFGGETFLLTV